MAQALEIQKSSEMPMAAGRQAITPMDMLDQAVSRGADIGVLEKLMGLQERWEANQARKAFDAAMADAKAKIPPILKNRKVDFTSQKGRTNYRHEDLGEIAKTVDPILAEFGLSYRFNTETAGGTVSVTCIVSHRDGHSERNTLSGAHDQSGNKNSIQAVGSTITYLQRYTLKAALGLAASNDDDGAKTEPRVEDTSAITEAQASVIRELVEKSKLEIEQFCGHWKVEAIPDIPMIKFNDVVSSLRRRIAFLAEQEGKNNG
jgi:hypothetical protein